jgi:hypothetical protein
MHFSVFCECPPGRTAEAKIVHNYHEIELHLQAEPPPDELIQKARIHATSILLAPMDEFILIHPPSRLSPKADVEVDGWPSPKAPAWTIWKYQLARDDAQESVHLETLPVNPISYG